MLTVTILTNDAEQLCIQISPVVIGVTDYLEVPDGICWSEKTVKELSKALSAGITVLDDHLIAVYVDRTSEKDRSTERVIMELAQIFGINRKQVETEEVSVHV